MYAFLLALGAVITAAGLVLSASGLSIQGHGFIQGQGFDAANVMPGLIAVIGGCILIGLAFVVRALLRVERALTLRPIPRPARLGEAAHATAAAAPTNEGARIPFPPKPKPAPHPQAAPAAVASAAPRTRAEPPPAFESLTEGSTTTAGVERIEHAPIVNESDVSLLPKAPARPDEETEINRNVTAVRANGTAHAASAAQVATAGRPARRPQVSKSTVFDALWPRTQPAGPAAHPAPASQAVPQPQPQPATAAEPPAYASPIPAPAPAPQGASAPQAAPAALSILKSGVVEGMPYTLYSDGSIEAQLAAGTLRFGSITELRNHIEQNG